MEAQMGISWLAPSVGAEAWTYGRWPVEVVAAVAGRRRRRRERDDRRRSGAAAGLRRGPAGKLRCRANQPATPAAVMAAETDADKLRFIEEVTADVGAVQERVLAEILARNADAEYLATRCGGLGGGGAAAATDRATFRAKVPMVTYEDLRPYIQRIAHGDRSPILSGSGHPVSEFVTSSGTSTGERKLIPAVEDDHDRHYRLHSLVMAVVNQYVPGLDKGSGLYFLFVRSETTPGGLPARTILTRVFKSDGFWKLPYNPQRGLTSPAAATVCEDTFQSKYAQVLCGLCYRHAVLRVGAAFASGLLRAVRFFLGNWEQLAADIDAGTLTDRVTDPSLRQALAGVLRQRDQELARFVRDEGSRGDADAAGIIARLWPNTKYLHVVATGSMAHYVPALNYYSGGLPIVTTAYFSSECSIGINLRPMCDPSEVSFTVVPSMAYFEFLPTDNDDDATAASASQRLVELAGVEAGREYELVVTTYSGLCRYRVGDVLRVTGFHKTAPQFLFVRRRDALLSVVGSDRTDEAELQRAVERASAALLRPRGAAVADYAARTCAETVPGHYVVYWELQLLGAEGSSSSSSSTDVVVDGDVLDRCCLEMEEALSSVYRQSRVADGSVGPLEIRVVQPGTFDELADQAVARGASIGQYKVPRCVAAPPVIELLDSRVVSSHFSPVLPHWEPVCI